MSLYNLINGISPACILVLPMLEKHPQDYPRFRDCFITEDHNIAIYTRVGGGNRNCGFGEEELYKNKNFIKTYDDTYDSTYGTYEFKVPEKWKADFNALIENRLEEVSNEYIEYLKKFWPEDSNAQNVIDKINQFRK